jgi:8-oxo-dGTP pyrophosphatase MutT (NUDIX family)
MPQKYKVFFNHNKLFIAKMQLPDIEFQAIYINPTSLKIKDLVILLIREEGAANYLIITDDLKKTWLEFCSFFEIRKAAGGLVLNTQQEKLFIKRNGLWDLPKGHLEKGEKNRAAALREVEEECGIQNVKITKKLTRTYHTYMLKKVMVLKPIKWYLMTYTDNKAPKPQKKEGITDVVWAKNNEIEEMLKETYSSIIEVVHKANSLAIFADSASS